MKVEMGSAHLAALSARAALTHVSWAQHPASVTHEGTTFLVLGQGAHRAALLGPDGVVYKAPLPTQLAADHFTAELTLFAAHDDAPWCPEYHPYPEHHVMAMRRYEPLTEPPPDPPDLTGVESTPQNLGRDEAGRLVVLDGGRTW